MAGDKTYITDGQGKLHRATRVHAVTPTDIVWSSNPNDYTVQVKIDGKWHRAVLTMDAGSSTFFDNINIDKALVTGADGKQHTALIVKPESTVTLSDIKTDTHGTIAGTTTGETAVSTYSENWSDVKWQDNVNVYKVLVTGSDGKVHTALLTTSAGGGTVQAIVLGPSPLLLPDAIANSLRYVKAFGGTEQRNLPDGYTQVDYIYFLANSYLITDINPTYDGRYEFDFQTTTLGASGATTYLGVRPSSSGNGGLRVARISSQVFRIYGFGAYQDSTTTAVANTRYKFVWDNQHALMTSGGSTVLDLTYTGTDACAYPITINGWNSAGTVTPGSEGIFVYSFKAWNAQGELVADYVPTKDPDGVVGFYDTVSESFKTATAGTLAAGPEVAPAPNAPMSIVSNNGALKYASNMANVNAQTALIGYYISASGVVTADANNWIYQDYIPVSPNTKYTLTMSSPVYYVTISEYSTADDSGFIRRNAGGAGDNYSLTITTDATTNFIRFGTNIDRAEVTLERVLAINWQLNKGNFMPYEPYRGYIGVYADGTVETIEDTIGNTATAEMLLKVGDHQDEQQILSGVVTRNVGVKVFDGTENITTDTYGGYRRFVFQDSVGSYSETQEVVCSHYVFRPTGSREQPNSIYLASSGKFAIYISAEQSFSTVQQFGQWLADQYAAGTPVIVIYPLATPTTESVAGQTLQVTGGDNVLEITQASLTGLELEAEYTKVE